MTIQEAIELFKRRIRVLKQTKKPSKRSAIYAMEMAIDALEKQIPKKPNKIGAIDNNDDAVVECVCGATQEVAVKSIKNIYCWRCGQRLDWSDTE